MFKALRDRLRGVSKKIEDQLEVDLEAKLEAELQESLAAKEEPAHEAAPETPAREKERPPAPEPAGPSDEPEGPAAEEERAVPAEEEQPAPAEQKPAPAEQKPAPAEQKPAPAQETPAPGPGRKPGGEQPRYGRKVLSDEEVERRLEREMAAAVGAQREVEQVAGGGARYTINEDVLEEILWELEIGLLESDVALPVIEAIKENVKDQLLSMSVGGRDPHDVVEKVLRSSIRRVLSVDPVDFDGFVKERLAAGKKPVVVMFVGVNGTGKTTSIARIAHRLKQKGISSVMAAGDTFRAGAIEQLALHGERLGVTVIKQKAGADPAAVCYDAIEHSKARNKDVVLLDTAGRMQTNRNLMDEMDKVRRVADPDMVVFVGDSLAGNDAVEQARRFDEIVDINGVILTKVDVDAKGGAALSVAYTIHKPLLFLGVGQDYDDLRPFDADWMVSRLFGDEQEVAA